MKPSVPFVIKSDTPLDLLVATEGMVSWDGVEIKIEFRTADGVFGLLKTKLHEVKIPVDGVNEIELRFRSMWFGQREHFLFIRVAEMGRASEIPTFKEGEILLPIAERHVQAATELVSAVRLAGGRSEA